MREQLKRCIAESAKRIFDLSPEQLPNFTVEVPQTETHGDFATNLAMMLSRTLRKSPRELAQLLSKDLSNLELCQKVEIAGPGFINFFIRPEAWQQVLRDIVAQGDDYGRRRNEAKAEPTMVEFVSANPTGPLHFGHGRGAVVGDVLANLLQFTGGSVQREFYVNDAGNQVQNLVASILFHLKKKHGMDATFPADGYHGAYVAELAAKVPEELYSFLPGEPTAGQLSGIRDFAVAQMLRNIQADLSYFGIHMDQYVSERSVLDSGRVMEALSELDKRGTLEDKDGARWFLSDRFGDEKPRVLVKSDGSHTYFINDIAYHLDKLRRGFIRLVNIWGADHHGYVPRMKAALAALGHPPENLQVLLVQMVSLLRDGQPVVMSKRAGEIVTLREVIEEVGVDAARFFFLVRGTDSQMEFDLELAKRHSMDNPVYYVQYGHARLSSILAKAAERGFPVPEPAAAASTDLSPLILAEELRLIKKMASFGDVTYQAAQNRAPHLLVFYLQELVAAFHQYYTTYSKTNPILGGEPNQVAARLIFVMALRQVLRCAMRLVGISAPDRMPSIVPDSKEDT